MPGAKAYPACMTGLCAVFPHVTYNGMLARRYCPKAFKIGLLGGYSTFLDALSTKMSVSSTKMSVSSYASVRILLQKCPLKAAPAHYTNVR